jgi:hypothetical protein
LEHPIDPTTPNCGSTTHTVCTAIGAGYILYFVLQDVCVVCFSTYAVNIGLLICSSCTGPSGGKKEKRQ